MKTTTIKIPVYNIDLVLRPLHDMDCIATVYIKGKMIFMDFEEKYIDLETIVHESVHVKNRILHLCNAKLDLLNDEHEAYLTEYIFKAIRNALTI